MFPYMQPQYNKMDHRWPRRVVSIVVLSVALLRCESAEGLIARSLLQHSTFGHRQQLNNAAQSTWLVSPRDTMTSKIVNACKMFFGQQGKWRWYDIASKLGIVLE